MDETSQTPAPEEPIVAEGVIIADSGNRTEPQSDNASLEDNVTPILGAPPPTLPAMIPAEIPPPPAADPEFDAYMAVIRLLVGGVVEGAAELAHRLEHWEGQLSAATGPLEPGEAYSTGDVARYMLVGMTLSAGEGLRRQVLKLTQASDQFWRLSGSAAQPLVNNRLTGTVMRPLDRAFDRLVTRGQKRVDGWIELGRAQEPGARRLARKAFLETVDDLIDHLSENEELAGLIQDQGVSLASEAVDEFRTRTVSADELAETIVRRILRRPPRTALPPPPEQVQQAVAEPIKQSRRP